MGDSEARETIYRLDGPLRWALGEGEALLEAAAIQPGMKVLDVGAGTGYLSFPAAAAVGDQGEVHCLDASPVLLAELERKADHRPHGNRLVPRLGSALALPYPDGAFDAVVSSYLLHELAEATPRVLCEMYRVLKPFGRLALADYRKIPQVDRRRAIEAWYARQPDGAGPEEVHLRFDLADIELLLGEAGFHSLRLSTWLDFHLHAIARK